MIKLSKNINKKINSIDKNDMEFILKYGKSSNIINKVHCQNIIEFSFSIVKIEVPNLLSNAKYLEIAELLFSRKFRTIKIQELIAFILWVKDQIIHINKIENAKLESIPETELVQAGINNLDQFGHLNVIDSLAKGDILKWNEISELPYCLILDKLAKSNVENQIQKNYQKIIEQKSKRK